MTRALLSAIALLIGCTLTPCDGAEPREDLLLADFEAADYGDWRTAGTAFGKGPARGTLPGQMPVSGFMGTGLVNSFTDGDAATGRLTSPEFVIQRDFINFLIGGGRHPDQTCVNLLIEGKPARTASGPNNQPGGSEQLAWQSWDVRELAGQRAVLEVVDNHTGGWGHINLDQVTQSDQRRGDQPALRTLQITTRYLLLPVKTGATMRRMRLMAGDVTLREFEIELAESEPDFWVFVDLESSRGQELTVATTLPAGSSALEAIRLSDTARGEEAIYSEPLRPQFHFTARRGWLNDPNGLVFFNGEYHLFFQTNPYGWNWGNMHWGHAISRDLVHWQELPIGIYPRAFGDWAFSGSAVVDQENTSGFGTADQPAMVAAFTSTGRGECIVFSRDQGRSWQEYEGNPVIKHSGRDPRLLWHEDSKQWCLAVYNEDGGRRAIDFYTSPNLKQWQKQSTIEGFFECPDLFELPISDKPGESRWVLYGADGKYLLGDFDGKRFTPSGEKQQLWHGNFYAAQTFSNAPHGRRIQIGWGQGITFPDMPFNQQMTIPVELTLHAGPGQPQMHAQPVPELANLYGQQQRLKETPLTANNDELLKEVTSQQLDIDVRFSVGDATAVGVELFGVPVTYDVTQQTLRCRDHAIPLPLQNGELQLRLLVDRGSIEVFGQQGRVALSQAVLVDQTQRPVKLFAQGDHARVVELVCRELKSAWPEQ